MLISDFRCLVAPEAQVDEESVIRSNRMICFFTLFSKHFATAAAATAATTAAAAAG